MATVIFLFTLLTLGLFFVSMAFHFISLEKEYKKLQKEKEISLSQKEKEISLSKETLDQFIELLSQRVYEHIQREEALRLSKKAFTFDENSQELFEYNINLTRSSKPTDIEALIEESLNSSFYEIGYKQAI